MVYQFDTEVAALVGADAAAVFQNIAFWCSKNAANGKHLHDGRYWTFNSVRALAELFPWLSAAQVRNALRKLVDAGLLVKGCYNKTAYDRTAWYAIGEKGLAFSAASICQNAQINLSAGTNQFELSSEPIPDEKTDSKPVKNTNKGASRKHSRDSAKQEPREAFGSFSNVYLSKAEAEAFQAEHPGDWMDRVETMSTWLAANGKSYRNYLAALRSWARRDEARAPSRPRADAGTLDAIAAAMGEA